MKRVILRGRAVEIVHNGARREPKITMSLGHISIDDYDFHTNTLEYLLSAYNQAFPPPDRYVVLQPGED